MERIRLKGVGTYPITLTTLDADGDPATVTSPTLVIKDGSGATVVGSPTAIVPDIDGNVLSYDIPVADLDYLDTYEAVWTGTVSAEPQQWRTPFELVGVHLFEIADLRASDTALADTTKFPDSVLQDVRTAVEEIVEDSAAVSVFPRGRREKNSSRGARLFTDRSLVRELYAVSIDGVALTSEQIADIDIDDGVLTRSGGWGSVVVLHYAHGMSYPPANLVRPAIALAKELLVSKVVSERVSGETTDFGFLRYTLEGVDGPTALRSLNAAIQRIARPGVFLG